MITLTIGVWNLCMLTDNTKSSRPERRTGLVVRELSRYCIQKAALIETRLANEGQLIKAGGGYKFFWSSHCDKEHHEAGGGVTVKSSQQVCMPTKRSE